MLGIFKGKLKDKSSTVDKKGSATKDEKKYSLRKSKSQDKNDKESITKDKIKEDKFPRFSFKRSKSLEKKRTKENNSQRGTLFTVSSTPSLLDGKDVSNDPHHEKGMVPVDDKNKDESETQSSYTVSSSDITNTSEKTIGDTSSSTYQSSSSTTNHLPDDTSDSSLSSSMSLVSEKYLLNCRMYPRKVPVFEHSFRSKPETPILSVVSSISYSAPVNSPYIVRKTDSQSSISEPSSKQLGSSAGDGSTSMLSTPSSSTSSLSSISGRPISPSGRRTPPGPKLGTGGLIPSSPTTVRKTTRTNIKTNPTVPSRKLGQLSPSSSTNAVIAIDKNSVPPFIIEQNDDRNYEQPSESSSITNSSTPTLTNGQSDELNEDSLLQENVHTPPQSPSPGIGRTRHSVSSMQSLESIPENENDLSSDSNEKSISRKSSNRKISPKLNSNSLDPKCKVQTLEVSKEQISEEPKTKTLLEDKSSSALTQTTEESDVIVNSEDSKGITTSLKDLSTTQNETSPLNDNVTVVTKKPPLVSKRSSKDIGKPPQPKEKSKLKLSVGTDLLKDTDDDDDDDDDDSEEIATKSAFSKEDKEKTQEVEEDHNNININGTAYTQKEDQSQLLNEDRCDIKENKYLIENNEPATHVIFRIPFSSSVSVSKSMKRATSLEIIPNSYAKFSFKDEIFPRSSSPVRSIPRRRRSASMPKFPPEKGETDVKFEIPITLEELKKQTEILSTSLKTDDESSSRVITKSILKHLSQISSYSEHDCEEDEKVWPKTGNSVQSTQNQSVKDVPNPKASDVKSTEGTNAPLGSSNFRISQFGYESEMKKFHLVSKDDKESPTDAPEDDKGKELKQEEDTEEEEEEGEEEEEEEEGEKEEQEEQEQEEKQQQQQEQEREMVGDSKNDTTETESERTKKTNELEGLTATSEAKQNSTNIVECSETDSTNENSDSQNVVQETITIQIDDKGKIKTNKYLSKELRNGPVNKSIQTSDEEETVTFNIYKKELADQEHKYQKQIDDLTIKLAEKQEEVVDLVEELSEVREKSQKNADEEALLIKIEDMKKQVKLKENTVECFKVELHYAKNQNDTAKLKIQRLEDDLSKTKELVSSLQEQNQEQTDSTASFKVELHYAKNQNDTAKLKIQRLEDDLSKTKELVSSLQEQNDSTARDSSRLKDMEQKVKKFEEDLRKSETVRKDLQTSLNEIEAERDEELKIVQDALDEAAQEREELIMTFEKELKHLNSTNTAREQQMMEDFEWKLREMEKDHKKKLEEKERQVEARLNAVRSVVESEFADSLTKVAEDRRIADEKLAEVGHLRSYEAEAIQLRGVTHEFQKALRASAREMENMKIREKLLEEEIRSLKTGSQSRQSTLHRVKCHSDEEEFRQRLEKMKNEMNAKWEDKLRSECSRLKSELDDLHSEEKHLAVESMKVQKEQEIQALKKSRELSQEEMTKKISTLKDSLTDKDAYYHKEMEALRTTSDRDIWDLRMKLQRLNESSYDKQQQLEEKHRDEMERFRVDWEDRIHELEARLATRDAQAGIDLLGELQKEHKSQMQHLQQQHRLSMERLREELESDKFQAVEEARVIITKHHEYVETNLKDQISEYAATVTQCREEGDTLRQTVARRDESLRSLKEELERLQESRESAEPHSNVNSPSNFSPSASSGLSSSQYSLTSSSDSQGSSRTSQDRFYLPENTGVVDNPDDAQRASNTGILGKVFGGGWFAPSKGKETTRRGSTPLSNKKTYGS